MTDERRGDRKRWSRLQKAVAAVLYDADPDGMGATVGAPADEYDDIATRIISALSRAPEGTAPERIVRNFYRDRGIAFHVAALWFAFDKPPEIEASDTVAWPVFITEGGDPSAFESSQALNDYLEPWYAELDGNVVWDARGRPLTMRRDGDPHNDMDGIIVVEPAPDLDQPSLDGHLAHWFRAINRPSLAEFATELRQEAALAILLAEHRMKFPTRGPITVLKDALASRRKQPPDAKTPPSP